MTTWAHRLLRIGLTVVFGYVAMSFAGMLGTMAGLGYTRMLLCWAPAVGLVIWALWFRSHDE